MAATDGIIESDEGRGRLINDCYCLSPPELIIGGLFVP